MHISTMRQYATMSVKRAPVGAMAPSHAGCLVARPLAGTQWLVYVWRVAANMPGTRMQP